MSKSCTRKIKMLFFASHFSLASWLINKHVAIWKHFLLWIMSSKDTFGYIGKLFEMQMKSSYFDNVLHFRISEYLNAEKVLQCACIYLM